MPSPCGIAIGGDERFGGLAGGPAAAVTTCVRFLGNRKGAPEYECLPRGCGDETQ